MALLYQCLELTGASGSTALPPCSPRRARCVWYGLDLPAEFDTVLIGPVVGWWGGCAFCRNVSSRERRGAKSSCSVSVRSPKDLRREGYVPLLVAGAVLDASEATVLKGGVFQLGEPGR